MSGNQSNRALLSCKVMTQRAYVGHRNKFIMLTMLTYVSSHQVTQLTAPFEK